METILWAAAGVLLLLILLWIVPARTTILIDTPNSTARAEMRVLWGLGPILFARALPRAAAGAPLAVFNDAARIGHALMTPSLADAAYRAVWRLFAHKPRVARVELGLNLADSAQNRVVQTGAEAAMATAPAALLESVRIYKCEAPGAELVGRFELDASPMQLASIYDEFKQSRQVQEFRKRLKAKPKPSKKAPREVRAP